MIGIYMIENKITSKKYIGQSINIERRFKNHISSSGKAGNEMYEDMETYGIDNFAFSIIELCDKSQLNKMVFF